MAKKVRKICSHCGSDDVLLDAYTEWDTDLQEWVLQNVFSEAYCINCEGETSLEDDPL